MPKMMPILTLALMLRADVQVHETDLPDVGSDELGCHLDGCEEQGEVAGSGVAKPDLEGERAGHTWRTSGTRSIAIM